MSNSYFPNPGRYSFIPAAIKYRFEGGMGIYVKYKHNHSKEIKLLYRSPTFDVIDCPDRTLYVVNNTHETMPWYPAESCDEFYSVSQFPDKAAHGFGIDIFMVNSINEITHKHTVANRPNNDRAKIIADSGGFQILGGEFSYINPRHLVEWYNKNVDYGIVLDIPIMINKDITCKLAKIQDKNTQIMLEHKDPALELVNIVQGITPDERRAHRDIVERDGVDRMALGGLQARLPIEMLSSALLTMLEGRKYKQYHILGLAQPLKSLLLIYLSNTGLCEYVTSDASTATLYALNNAMLIAPSPNLPMSLASFTIKENYHPTIFSEVACSCPVCRAVKYTDVFSLLNGHRKIALMVTHNVLTLTRYFKMMKDIFLESTPTEIKKLATQVLNKKDCADLCDGINFIEEVRNSGLAKADLKYKYFIQKPKPLVEGMFESNLKQKQYKSVTAMYKKRPDVFFIKNEKSLTKKKKIHSKPSLKFGKLKGMK